MSSGSNLVHNIKEAEDCPLDFIPLQYIIVLSHSKELTTPQIAYISAICHHYGSYNSGFPLTTLNKSIGNKK